MARMRSLAAIGAATSMLVLAACSGDGDSDSAGGTGGNTGGDTVITWWHNGNNDPLRGFFDEVAAEYEEANDGVTIQVSALQNEDLRTRLTTALQSNDPPHLFQQWGGGEMAVQVNSDRLMDLTDEIPEAIESVGGSAAGWQLEGRTYGLPWTLGVVGFWYNTAMFDEAGINEPPATMDEWFDAVDALKAAGFTPVAVGAADEWPAGHWWYYTAVRECSEEVLEQASVDYDFSDPCFIRAGELLESIVEVEPFNRGYLGTSAQQGAGSSAGLLANGQVAMELMGHWNPGVMRGLTEDEQGLGDDLGWFPFPSSPTGEGDPAAALGGGDGFSCAASAPPECADFLAYILSEDVQRRFAATGVGIPTADGTQDAVDDPALVQVLEFRDNAPYVQLYLDTAYGPAVGGALNREVVRIFGGEGSPQEVVDAMTAAANE